MIRTLVNITLIVTLLIPAKAVSQSYIPLIGQSNIWSVTSCFSGCITDSYYFSKDTTINSISYKVLDGYHYISGTFLVREEISSKKVYMGILDGTKLDEFLIYDFDLQVGDSVQVFNPISPIPTNIGKLHLDSVSEQTLIDGLNHTFYYFSSNNNQYRPVWVEGIGSLSLINAPCATPDVNGIGNLSCYSKDYVFTYNNLDSIENCNANIALAINKPLRSEIQIHSIPVLELIKIQNVKPGNGVYLYDLSGKLLVHEIVRSENEFQLNVAGINNGLYIINITNSTGRSFSKKIVIF